MKDRIKKLMEIKHLTSSQFADEVKLNRPAVSHIISGRNNPSLDALQHILTRYPEVNAAWLINGTGNMFSSISEENEQSIFNENINNVGRDTENSKYSKENEVKHIKMQPNISDNKGVNPIKTNVVKVKKIAVFYADNTYEEFYPNKI